MRRLLLPTLFTVGAALCACSAWSDDISVLSDEFDDSATLSDWSRIYQVEGWGADQMASVDIGESRDGYMTLIPRTSSWYQNWRGILMFKLIEGDFVATMEVEPRNRALNGAPNSSYSLAGIMARTPRDNVTQPSEWTPGGENYLFLSLGTGNDPGNYQFEVKSTTDSSSNLDIDPGAPRAVIQVARVGDVFLVLRKLEGGEWEVHRRYRRTDMPDTLQVGITVYTDWGPVSEMSPFEHNQTAIEGENPDLNAAVDYFRYRRPWLPPEWDGANFFDPNEVHDDQIIALFGDRANRAPGEVIPSIVNSSYAPDFGYEVLVNSEPGYTYQLQWSDDMETWLDVDEATAYYDTLSFSLDEAVPPGGYYLRVATSD